MYSVNNNLDKFKDDDIFDTTNPFYQLLEKQATEFELFGQRLKSDIQNSYREFMKFQRKQQRNQEIAIDSKLDEAFEKVSKDANDSQSELIDSLKARIEELETDSKSEIRRLKQELNEFKSNIMLLFDQSTMFPQSDHKRIKDIFEKLDNNAEDDISIEDEDTYSTKDWVKEEFEESIKFSIPWAFYRFINGKGGYLVNQIQIETKTNITIGNPIAIRGSKDGIETAKKRLEEIIESANKPRNEKSDTSNTKTKGGKGGKRNVESIREPDNKEGFENITIRFNISQHLRGAIFGRGGKILNQITDETKTKIKIQPNGDSTISGTRDRVEMAKKRIEDIIAENERSEKDHVIKDSKRPAEENITVKIKIPLSLVGPVIGRGGKTLNQIRDESQTKIKIQSNGDSTIIGTRDGVEMAKRRIETIMEQVHKSDNKKPKDIDIESIDDDKEDYGEEFEENTEIKLSMVPMAPTTFNDLLSKD